MSKPRLTLTEIDDQAAVELPERHLFARAVGAGGLVGVGVAVDNVNVPITVTNNEICVGVAAINSQAC